MCDEEIEHYLVDLIINDVNDELIIETLENRLPDNCDVESDNLFLRIEFIQGKLSEEMICKLLEIPHDCVIDRSTKKDKNEDWWNVIYIAWEKVAGAII